MGSIPFLMLRRRGAGCAGQRAATKQRQELKMKHKYNRKHGDKKQPN